MRHNIFAFAFALLSANAWSLDVKGNAGAEARYFTDDQKTQVSGFGELELYWKSETSNNTFTGKVFGRADDTDSERTHADIREFAWLHYEDTWEVRAGVSKVFWGVTESAHRVDIINQTDGVESPDGEEKLGQPMLQFASLHDWGTLNAFVLPYFRERTFAGEEGYLGLPLPVDKDNTQYQSSNEQQHLDWALRYKHTVNIWDIGLSHFAGTARDPLLLVTGKADGSQVFTPYYRQIQQTGIDIQATLDAWLWKLEAIHQRSATQDLPVNLRPAAQSFSALTAGFEYTLIGLAGTAVDLGLLAEYHRNSEQQLTTDPMQNDLFIGARFTLNDIQNSAVLIGFVHDLDYSSQLGFIEASRRLGDNWVITLDGRYFASNKAQDPIAQFDKADHITLNVSYYF